MAWHALPCLAMAVVALAPPAGPGSCSLAGFGLSDCQIHLPVYVGAYTWFVPTRSTSCSSLGLSPSSSTPTHPLAMSNLVLQSPHVNSQVRGTKNPPFDRNSVADSSPTKKDIPRHSPVAPLAPLEYLQNQRRGSITDPSLHAAAPN